MKAERRPTDGCRSIAHVSYAAAVIDNAAVPLIVPQRCTLSGVVDDRSHSSIMLINGLELRPDPCRLLG
jgi:hypothetical protein